MEKLRDIVVELGAEHSGKIESWLLGHGRLPKSAGGAPSGRVRYYLAGASRFEIDELCALGGVVTRHE